MNKRTIYKLSLLMTVILISLIATNNTLPPMVTPQDEQEWNKYAIQ